MKREFAEITDKEWESHSSFKPSRVLKINTQSPTPTPRPKPPPPPPPPIESFAYKSGNLDENLEDDDVEEMGPIAITNNRGRRFIVDDDDDDEEEEQQEQEQEQEQGDFAEVYEIKSSSEEEEEEVALLEDENDDDDDVVGKALQKCAKISAELKRELYGTSSAVVTACDRYAEVESSSVRIVTQNDIDDACGAEDSDFQPVLKPYQLVGVNFLLLLYRKGIAGGNTFISISF